MARPINSKRGQIPIFNFRMDIGLRKTLERKAAEKGLTLSAFIRMVLHEAIK